MSGSRLDRWIEQTANDAVRSFIHSDRFKEQLGKHVRWAVQDFEPGYRMKDREAFTATVADRIRQKARRPIYLFGYRIWRARMAIEECQREAERIVTDFLKDERIKFGDPRFYWGDGIDLADADMDYWESCP